MSIIFKWALEFGLLIFIDVSLHYLSISYYIFIWILCQGKYNKNNFSIFPPHLFSWWVWKGLDVWWNSEGELWGLDITNNLSWCSSNLFHITEMNYNMVGFCYCLEFLLKITTLVGMSKVMIQLDCLLIFFLIGSVDKCVFRYLLVTCIIFISKL